MDPQGNWYRTGIAQGKETYEWIGKKTGPFYRKKQRQHQQ